MPGNGDWVPPTYGPGHTDYGRKKRVYGTPVLKTVEDIAWEFAMAMCHFDVDDVTLEGYAGDIAYEQEHDDDY